MAQKQNYAQIGRNACGSHLAKQELAPSFFPLIRGRRVRRAGVLGRKRRPVAPLFRVMKNFSVAGSSQAPIPPGSRLSPKGDSSGFQRVNDASITGRRRCDTSWRCSGGQYSSLARQGNIGLGRLPSPRRIRIDSPAPQWRGATRKDWRAMTAYQRELSVLTDGGRPICPGAPRKAGTFRGGGLPERRRGRREGL